MFQCCYTDKISALVTCYILDQNQNPRLSANTRTPQSSSPQIQMLFVSRENLLSSSLGKQSVGGESNTNILFIGGELFRVQSGGTIFVGLHVPAAHKWKSLSAIGGFGCPERSASVRVADTLDYPLAFRWNL